MNVIYNRRTSNLNTSKAVGKFRATVQSAHKNKLWRLPLCEKGRVRQTNVLKEILEVKGRARQPYQKNNDKMATVSLKEVDVKDIPDVSGYRITRQNYFPYSIGIGNARIS